MELSVEVVSDLGVRRTSVGTPESARLRHRGVRLDVIWNLFLRLQNLKSNSFNKITCASFVCTVTVTGAKGLIMPSNASKRKLSGGGGKSWSSSLLIPSSGGEVAELLLELVIVVVVVGGSRSRVDA